MKESGLFMELHSKERFKKHFITDIAIKKIPYIRYKGLTEEQNCDLQKLAQMVLLISQQDNNSNEVALTTSLHSGDMLQDAAVAIGDEHGVNIRSDTKSNHLIVARQVFITDKEAKKMSEYTLNDIGFTPGPIEHLPIGSGTDNVTDEELQDITRRNRESFDRLWADFEERTRDLVVS